MAFHRLTWRVGAPFVLLMCATTLALAWFIPHHLAQQDTARFGRVATALGEFVAHKGLPVSQELASDLSRVTGNTVFARVRGRLQPEPQTALRPLGLAEQAADGRAVDHPGFQSIAIPGAGGDFVIVRDVDATTFSPFLAQLLGPFVLLLLLTAWLVVRGLVHPLRNLMEQLPRIESDERLEMTEVGRADEIGDLARAFVRTRQALREERTARERAEKLAVLGRMTAALAHEVQNPVAAIRMHAQLLRGGADTDSARTIEHEVGRIESMLNQWLFLTRPEPPALARLDIGALLARIVAMHQAQAHHAAVVVQFEAARDLCVDADGRRMDQVFRNLLTNALQAMPGGGTLTIRAAHRGARIAVEFLDSGRGFSPRALERFAEFFFSEREGGMGIGLSVVNEILRAHGGSLEVANRPGGGAHVTVQLGSVAEAVSA